MRITVVGHEGADDGFIGDHLRTSGATIVRVARDAGALADAATADAVVLLGSAWSVAGEEHADAIDAEIALAGAAANRGVPVLGICYGAQLLAVGAGLTVAAAARPEIGWRHVEARVPALSGSWFEHHFDAWSDAAPGEIARTRDASQAFWHGRSLGVQFHPEVRESTIERWMAEGRWGDPPVVDVEAVLAETRTRIGASRARCGALLDYFLAHAPRRAIAVP